MRNRPCITRSDRQNAAVVADGNHDFLPDGGVAMLKRAIKCFGLSAGIIIAGSAVGFRPNDLIIHEWGTFTTVAGPDGQAVDWYALAEASDLPCFVEGLHDKPRT